MDYPGTIQIETSSVCNAACSFCPHSTMTRTAKDQMPDELFYGLINQIAGWEVKPSTIHPFLTNEPFADKRIYDFCCYINQKLPDANLVFFTNGSLFTESNLANRLAYVKNINQMFVSIHHSTAEEYHQETGLLFGNTVASSHRLYDHCQQRGIKLTILRVSDGAPDKDTRFQDFVAEEFPDAVCQISYRYNWKGDISSPNGHENTLDIACPRHSSMCILCDGRVALCCMDQAGEFDLGDTNTHTLLDIYNGDKAVAYRSRLRREMTPCNRCNMS